LELLFENGRMNSAAYPNDIGKTKTMKRVSTRIKTTNPGISQKMGK